MRIVLIGADGQLGTDLAAAFAGEDLVPLTWPDFDVTRPDAGDRLAALRPGLVVNTSAFHRVDECETHAREAFEVNALAVGALARAARALDVPLVHFSTDYVFDGRKGSPYVEDDPPGPLNVYAASKLAGEHLLRMTWEKHYLVRTCGLFGRAGSREKGTNFVESMIRGAGKGAGLRVVADQRVTPTSCRELAARVARLVRTGRFGLYHLTNEGSCTWYEFAREIFDLTGLPARLEPVTSEAYGAPARRPLYSVLENRNARAAGLPDFSPWTTALRDYLAETGRLPVE